MDKHSLIGTYQLVSWENRAASGQTTHPLGPDAQGLINYSQDGYMFVQIMASHRRPHAVNELFAGDIDEIKRSAITHLSYCGRFELQGNEVIHHVQICSFPNWVNTEQRRAFNFNDGQLHLTAFGIQSGGETVDAHLVWRRVAAQ
jgi:hypothetical protein